MGHTGMTVRGKHAAGMVDRQEEPEGKSQRCSCWLAFHQLGENGLLTFYPTLFLESFKQIDPHLSLWITAVSRLYSFFKLWLFTTDVSNTGSSKNKCDVRVEAGQQLYPYLA